jgi:glycosyltransferase involved in cell wall biosynthesis
MAGQMASPLSIAHVTPYPWEESHEVNNYVRLVSSELSQRGHRVLILAPSCSAERVRGSRRTLRSARSDPGMLLSDSGVPTVLAVGEVLGVTPGSRRRAPGLPIDLARTIEELLGTVELDFVHLHEPFAPSAASAALRHSRSLNVGSFHAPAEHMLSTQVARRFVETFFGRLDARVASFDATAQLMNRHFPSDYRVIMGGAGDDDGESAASGRQGQKHPVRLLYIENEERPALRLLLRALRHLQADTAWQLTVSSSRGDSSITPLRASLRENVSFVDPSTHAEAQLLATADVIICSSEGAMTAPSLLLRALGRGVVPAASRLPVYEEVLGEGDRGLLFEPGDALTLSAQLTRLIDDDGLRRRLRETGLTYARKFTWQRTTTEIEAVYKDLLQRRHNSRDTVAVRRRLARRELIDVDLHMHTDHSHDCATPVEVLLAAAREQGLGAIAVTDHNEISGALEAREKAAAAGVKVIVAEEVKTASQGEVIGLFIEEKIPRGLTLTETVAEIKRQGGLVYVPHPFDRMHSVPDYEHLLTILEDVDAIEVFNPRVAIGAFNEEAVRFAAKYRIVAGAGSDSHVAQGLGSVRIRMRDFDGPEEFLASLREADIITRPTSLLYVQALKFIQTRATPAAARRARRARQVRRATQDGKRNG